MNPEITVHIPNNFSYLVSDYLIVPYSLIELTLLSNCYYQILHYHMVSERSRSTAIRAFSSTRNKNKRTATRNDDKRSHRHHKLLTIRNTKFINSKFTSQIKENQSWPQSKTQTWLLIQYPPPQQYPDPSELTD